MAAWQRFELSDSFFPSIANIIFAVATIGGLHVDWQDPLIRIKERNIPSFRLWFWLGSRGTTVGFLQQLFPASKTPKKTIERPSETANSARRAQRRPTASGHVTSLITWPLDSPCHFLRVLHIVTEFLSMAVFEILGPKDIGVTTLTFRGHLASSVTWPFDSPYAISYKCSIRTESLCPAAFKIGLFGSNIHSRSKSNERRNRTSNDSIYYSSSLTNEHTHARTHTNKHDGSQYLLTEIMIIQVFKARNWCNRPTCLSS